jgi:hypothetical protein
VHIGLQIAYSITIHLSSVSNKAQFEKEYALKWNILKGFDNFQQSGEMNVSCMINLVKDCNQ